MIFLRATLSIINLESGELQLLGPWVRRFMLVGLQSESDLVAHASRSVVCFGSGGPTLVCPWAREPMLVGLQPASDRVARRSWSRVSVMVG